MKYLTLVMLQIAFLSTLFAQDATEIVRKADETFRGKSSKSTMTMKIIRPKWEREMTMKSWSKGDDYAMVVILSPAKDKGQAFLKRGNNLWNWVPSISRMVKMPPSMMSQGWMGSDVSNDDLMRQSSLVADYSHKILAAETVSGKECYKIELIPKEDADVVWGKILMWVTKDNYLVMKQEYYDEDEYLVHTETASDIKMMDGRMIPTRLEIIPADEPDQRTILIFNSIDFDIDIEESFFSQQNMKSLR